jgi:hypothetical protein
MMSSWGWEELVDERGVKYYGNPELKITQYQHPSLGIVGVAPQAALSSKYSAPNPLSRTELPKHNALALPYGWESLKDSSGYTYSPNSFSSCSNCSDCTCSQCFLSHILVHSDFLEQLLRESSAQDIAVSASFSGYYCTKQESRSTNQQLS